MVKPVALVELALLFGGKASALLGVGDCCCWMQWRLASWCFSSEREHRLWLAKVTADAGEGSGARRADASLRGEHRRWLATVTADGRCSGAHRATVLLLEERASVLVGGGNCCWWLQWCLSSRGFSSRRASALVGDGDRCWWMQWRSSSWHEVSQNEGD